jgi:thiol-disulfide isomerase/thioredoxin
VQDVNVNDFLERLHLPIESHLPEFAGATAWLNSEPLTTADLRGKVVAVDFWTYTCINWLRTLPYLRAWAKTYADKGLVVTGVHTPEFGVEHDLDNVRRAARDMHIDYPIVVDNDYAIWEAFANQYWPALYVADAEGRIRHHHFGEGGYKRSEHVIRTLLADAGAVDLPAGPAPVHPQGIEVEADSHNLRSPETYVGFARSTGAFRGDGAFGEPHAYSVPPRLRRNEWALDGNWTVRREDALLNEPNGSIAYRFHARDLNLILTPPSVAAPARFRVRLEGESPRDSHGLDIDAEGNGVVREPRLYQLIREPERVSDRLFEIEFLDPGVGALCFTFG